MAGEVGGSERVCLLPAHKDAFPAELTCKLKRCAGSQRPCHSLACRAAISGIPSAPCGAGGSSALSQFAQSPQEWLWRGTGGLGKEGDLLHFL